MKISHVTVDCHQPAAIAGFWAEALGWAEDPDDPNLPDQDEAIIFSPDRSQNLLFLHVPEDKQVKNRVHIDIAPTDSTRDVEVDRLVRNGASIFDDLRNEDGTGWVVMQDPDGNEFCVVRADSERTTGN